MNILLLEGDALHIPLPDESINLVIADPPYFKVKKEKWDNQWKNDDLFIDWLGMITKEIKRILTPNGSLYLFASPRLSARVEIEVGKFLRVLNRITWKKPIYSTKAEMFRKEDLTKYFPSSEFIIFAEKFGSNDEFELALGKPEYILRWEQSKKQVIGDYLQGEFDRAQTTRKEIAGLFPSKTGGLTGCVSNWVIGYNIPTEIQYLKMREYLNNKNGTEYLRREYEYLRREYEDLRREYEDLRREYEDLRRPFFANENRPYTDVWEFKTVGTYSGKHPCEKPLEMIEHMVKTSSRKNDLILDCFLGGGVTGVAAMRLDRDFVGIDNHRPYLEKYAKYCEPKRWLNSKKARGGINDLPLFNELDY